LDGIKLFLDVRGKDGATNARAGSGNGSAKVKGADPWILLRASGTEPLLRVYVEAASPDLVQTILAEAEEFVLAKASTVSG